MKSKRPKTYCLWCDGYFLPDTFFDSGRDSIGSMCGYHCIGQSRLAGLPVGLTTVNLSGNDLESTPDSSPELIKALAVMPVNIKTVMISDKNIDMTTLRKIAPLEQEIIMK